ncbi:MAG: ACT domain-containing protein [Hoeflea sp.]|uniref:ACT domain-containing protein n=1 Tax=Hoeflea sp. TaxID=1940281 RepID=UPI002731D900|nr:ACT domain-containing protein [Hoeflea sp.]MDP2118532.1 ACT domain-containing protein [Hoeflea sp.]
MPEPIKDREAMIASMTPELRPGRFVFCALNDLPLSTTMRDGAICLFREAEGVSVLLPVDLAEAEGLPVEMPMCQITLQVFSSLAGVGLTAGVSAALGAANIPCNMIAAALHDHVFVPEDRAKEALAVLLCLSASAR